MAQANPNHQRDRNKLKNILQSHCTIPFDDQARRREPIVRALNHHGITQWRGHFICTSGNTLLDLTYTKWDPVAGRNVETNLRTADKHLLHALYAYHHEGSYLGKREFDVERTPPLAFHDWRANSYSPDTPVVPWMVRIDKDLKHDNNEWTKVMRPSINDFPKFKDVAEWPKTKEKYWTAFRFTELTHTINPNHVIVNSDLDKKQTNWVFKMLQTQMTEQTAKAIINAHLVDQDTRIVWPEICDKLDRSQASKIKSGTISTYVTGTRLLTSGWRGTYESAIAHYVEQLRLYSNIAPQDFTDDQKIQFTHNFVTGIDSLSSVLTLNQQARAAAGIATVLTFAEYTVLLLNAAQVLDGGTKSSRSRRSAHKTEIILNDGVDYLDIEYENNAHDITHDVDTPVEHLLANAHSQDKPRSVRVLMDTETWNKLTPDAKKTWSRLDDNTKRIILSQGKIKDSTRSARTHETDEHVPQAPQVEVKMTDSSPADLISFDQDAPAVKPVLQPSATPKPSSHRDANSMGSILFAATHKQTAAARGDLDAILSSAAGFKASNHEFVDRSMHYDYEVNMAERGYTTRPTGHGDADPNRPRPPSATYSSSAHPEYTSVRPRDATSHHVHTNAHAPRPVLPTPARVDASDGYLHLPTNNSNIGIHRYFPTLATTHQDPPYGPSYAPSAMTTHTVPAFRSSPTTRVGGIRQYFMTDYAAHASGHTPAN